MAVINANFTFSVSGWYNTDLNVTASICLLLSFSLLLFRSLSVSSPLVCGRISVTFYERINSFCHPLSCFDQSLICSPPFIFSLSNRLIVVRLLCSSSSLPLLHTLKSFLLFRCSLPGKRETLCQLSASSSAPHSAWPMSAWPLWKSLLIHWGESLSQTRT